VHAGSISGQKQINKREQRDEHDCSLISSSRKFRAIGERYCPAGRPDSLIHAIAIDAINAEYADTAERKYERERKMFG